MNLKSELNCLSRFWGQVQKEYLNALLFIDPILKGILISIFKTVEEIERTHTNTFNEITPHYLYESINRTQKNLSSSKFDDDIERFEMRAFNSAIGYVKAMAFTLLLEMPKPEGKEPATVIPDWKRPLIDEAIIYPDGKVVQSLGTTLDRLAMITDITCITPQFILDNFLKRSGDPFTMSTAETELSRIKKLNSLS